MESFVIEISTFAAREIIRPTCPLLWAKFGGKICCGVTDTKLLPHGDLQSLVNGSRGPRGVFNTVQLNRKTCTDKNNELKPLHQLASIPDPMYAKWSSKGKLRSETIHGPTTVDVSRSPILLFCMEASGCAWQ